MSKTHQVLVIGGGSIGERHVRSFLATRRCTVAVCEPNELRLRQLADRYDLAADFKSTDELTDYVPDISVIATPADLHVDQAIAHARRGSHLLIEKPLSTSLERVAELLDIVKSQDLIAGVAYVYRVHPALTAMAAELASQRWGTPKQFIIVGGQHFPTYRPQYREIYYNNPAQGGGAVQDALTHLLDCGRWLVGPITRLCADAEHLALPGVEVEDAAAVLTRQGEALGCYVLNQFQGADELTMTVVCERGMCRFENHLSRWQWIDGVAGSWHDVPTPLRNRDDLYQRQAEAFLDAVERHVDPPCSLVEGASTLAACQAVLDSWREQRWVEPIQIT